MRHRNQVAGRTGVATEAETTYDFRAADEAHIRVLIVQTLAGSAFTLRGLSSQDIDGGRVEVDALLTSMGPDRARLEQAVSRLSLEPGVSAVNWQVRDSAGIALDGEDSAEGGHTDRELLALLRAPRL